MADYTELSIQDRITHIRGMIRELESNQHMAEKTARMNAELMRHWKGRSPSAFQKAKAEVTTQTEKLAEYQIGLGVLRSDLDELQAELPAEPEKDDSAADPGAEPASDEKPDPSSDDNFDATIDNLREFVKV